MTLNKSQMDDIKFREAHGTATSDDCALLLEHISYLHGPEYIDQIKTVVERAIETTIPTGRIVEAIERAVKSLKSE